MCGFGFREIFLEIYNFAEVFLQIGLTVQPARPSFRPVAQIDVPAESDDEYDLLSIGARPTAAASSGGRLEEPWEEHWTLSGIFLS